mmetsp:Transcript_31031/g.70539  ORF Transcript_31031/g.70539 Transcript_31031/m.70539 type:complete len:232 (-) Transcript_31031:21-716(-)
MASFKPSLTSSALLAAPFTVSFTLSACVFTASLTWSTLVWSMSFLPAPATQSLTHLALSFSVAVHFSEHLEKLCVHDETLAPVTVVHWRFSLLHVIAQLSTPPHFLRQSVGAEIFGSLRSGSFGVSGSSSLGTSSLGTSNLGMSNFCSKSRTPPAVGGPPPTTAAAPKPPNSIAAAPKAAARRLMNLLRSGTLSWIVSYSSRMICVCASISARLAMAASELVAGKALVRVA